MRAVRKSCCTEERWVADAKERGQDVEYAAQCVCPARQGRGSNGILERESGYSTNVVRGTGDLPKMCPLGCGPQSSRVPRH